LIKVEAFGFNLSEISFAIGKNSNSTPHPIRSTETSENFFYFNFFSTDKTIHLYLYDKESGLGIKTDFVGNKNYTWVVKRKAGLGGYKVGIDKPKKN